MRHAILLWLLLALPVAGHAQDGFEKAREHYGNGEYAQAADLLRQLAKVSPKDPEIRFWLGRSHTRLRQWKEAARAMEDAVKLAPGNARYHLWLGRAYGDRASRAFFTSAFSLARKVVKEFETARDLAPRDIDVRFDLLEYYLEAPGIVGGGKDKAAAEARAIAEIDPVKKFIADATIYIKNKEWTRAKAALLQSTVEHPRNASAHKDLAEYLFARQEYPGVLEHAKAALKLDPRHKGVQMLVAAAQIRMKKELDQALGALRDLVRGPLFDGDPAFEEAYFWLGECHLARGDAASARQALQSALRYNPEYSRAKDALNNIK